MLVMLAGLVGRVWFSNVWRLLLARPWSVARGLLPGGVLALGVALVLLMPLLVGVAYRYENGRLPETPVYWRSSPRGLDLLSFVSPNPNLPWLDARVQRAFMTDAPDGFPELAGSFSLVALGVVAVAAWRRQLPRFWMSFTLLFTVLALGPFVHVAGFNTQMIGPWALLRYVPVIGLARTPSRFAVIATLGFSVLLAWAIHARRDTWRSNRLAAGLVAVGLTIELLPIPRALYDVDLPAAYQMIAADNGRPGRVLELPTGIRDGTSSLGNFNARTMYYQTRHRRPVVGGYLSRVSEWRRRQNRRDLILNPLSQLSSGAPMPPPDVVAAARGARDAFLARSCLAFVVVDLRKASPALRAFSRDALRLESVFADDRYEVLIPVEPPPCAAPNRPERVEVALR
jgi:hypothetical protein